MNPQLGPVAFAQELVGDLADVPPLLPEHELRHRTPFATHSLQYASPLCVVTMNTTVPSLSPSLFAASGFSPFPHSPLSGRTGFF